MFEIDFWQNVWITISRNKWRSLFTAFGVFWGIFMLVVLVGFGSGISRSMMEQVGHISANSSFLFSSRTTEACKGFNKGRYWELSLDDMNAVIEQFPSLIYVSGIIFGGSSEHNTAREDKQGTFQVMGFSPNYNKINPSRILEGRFINELDILEHRKVCIVGKKVKNDLYSPDEQILGSLLRVNGIYYNVVGVMEEYSSNVNLFGNTSETIVVPFSTLQITQNFGKNLHCIAITAGDKVDIHKLEDEVKTLLKERNMISPTDPEGVEAFNLATVFNTFRSLLVGIGILVWFVGLGTLFAGVVGVSNIMLITVRERTQEIGILRALGASPGAIIRQIMCESVTITFLAGIVGILCGVGLLSFFENIFSAGDNPMMKNFQISFSTAIVSLLILMVCGLLSGLLPSSRAIKIKAIEALRDE
ncbi:MAG: ABC transporter permease [Prevotellaceae bacterium]|jgi:putative ABC transport system permease protein|nr:ABC transporter permease [Prevotellaceae bacterium]